MKDSRFIGQNHFEILKKCIRSSVWAPASCCTVWCVSMMTYPPMWWWWWWGGLSLTEKHLFETNTGHILEMFEIHCFNWLIDWCDAERKPQGDQWTHPPRQSQSLKVLNGTRRKVCITRGLRDRGTNPDSECEDRQMARSHEVKVKGLKTQLDLSQNKSAWAFYGYRHNRRLICSLMERENAPPVRTQVINYKRSQLPEEHFMQMDQQLSWYKYIFLLMNKRCIIICLN